MERRQEFTQKSLHQAAQQAADMHEENEMFGHLDRGGEMSVQDKSRLDEWTCEKAFVGRECGAK